MRQKTPDAKGVAKRLALCTHIESFSSGHTPNLSVLQTNDAFWLRKKHENTYHVEIKLLHYMNVYAEQVQWNAI